MELVGLGLMGLMGLRPAFPPRRGRGEVGSAAVAVVAMIALLGVLVMGLGDLGAFLIARARAQTAADSAALAAAAQLLPGTGQPPMSEAARFARANGAQLTSCSCSVGTARAEVTVSVPVRLALLASAELTHVVAQAAAEVDWRSPFPGEPGVQRADTG